MPPPLRDIPQFPALLAAPLRAAPLGPLSLALTLLARSVARRRPGLFRRLGEHGRARFVLEPTDLPFVILLDPGGGAPSVRLVRGRGAGAARIRGPLAALLGLAHGAFDGDALFFSRDLTIEGDVSAVLALRNAVDDGELDLSLEVARLFGPMEGPLRRLFAEAERRSGVSLTRAEETEGEMAW